MRPKSPSPFLIASGLATTSMSMLNFGERALIVSKFDTTKATKYVDIDKVSLKVSISQSISLEQIYKDYLFINKIFISITIIYYVGWTVVFINGALKSELVKFLCLIIVSWNLAFKAGSSKHGKARLASTGSKCVDARLKIFFYHFRFTFANSIKISEFMI